jgi:pimeloyl-ACP methyl ester carboxylesterase
MTGASAWRESTHEVAGTQLHLKRTGKGSPLLLLHHDTGPADELPIYQSLAARFEVLLPHYPGFGKSRRPEWMRSVRDIAVVYQALLAQLEVTRPVLLGLGFGGWIAAEMATFAPRDVSHLVLVGAMGVKPPEGDIFDQALVSYIDYARAGFHDQTAFDRVYGKDPSTDQLEQWDICREMCFRIAWKPYMYSQTLPHLARGISAKTLIVWGDQDRIVPPSAGRLYQQAIPGSRLQVVKDCGHCVDMERPHDLAELVLSFTKQS